MAAFNYRQLIRQVPARSWKFYFQTRKIALPEDYNWDMPADKLAISLIAHIENLDSSQAGLLHRELRQVHEFANQHGIYALRNAAKANAPLHDDLLQLSSDAERALWIMANWPELYGLAAAILAFNLKSGSRGWKRLKIAPCDQLHRGEPELRALEKALAAEFTPRKGAPRACQIETFDRHLDGGVQMGILIEDNPQQQLEFGEDDRAHWRATRPPLAIDLVIYPASGVIDILVPGGKKAQTTVLTLFGRHILKKAIQPQAILAPMFFLNRLRDGFELFDDSQVDLAAHQVEYIRLSQARLRSALPPLCDLIIKPNGMRESPDALECVRSHQLDHRLLGSGFNIIEAVVTIYFLPSGSSRIGRVLHIELKQSGISNLRNMTEDDAKLSEALLLAWGVMQPIAANIVALADVPTGMTH